MDDIGNNYSRINYYHSVSSVFKAFIKYEEVNNDH